MEAGRCLDQTSTKVLCTHTFVTTTGVLHKPSLPKVLYTSLWVFLGPSFLFFDRSPTRVPHSAHALPHPHSSSHPFTQTPTVLNRYSAAPFRYTPHASLHHRSPEQPPSIANSYSQLFARRGHRVVLPFEFQLALLSALRCEKRPCATDSPVSERAIARKA